MKRLSALFLLVIWAALSQAQTSTDLIELDTSALEESAWQDIYRQLDELPLSLKLQSKLYLTDSGSNSLQNILYKLDKESLLLNHKHDWQKDKDYLNFSLKLNAKDIDATLGAYRYQFGKGLVSGFRSQSDSLFILKDPTTPASYTPLGAAVSLRHKTLRAGIFASFQKRQAHIAEGSILSLPSTRSDLLSTTQENIVGSSLGYSGSRFKAAALLYYRQYDKPFADSLLYQKLWAYSIYGFLRLSAHAISGEAAFLHNDPSCLLSWEYKLKGFTQTLSYAHNGFYGQLPYSVSPAVLNTADERDEYSYSLNIPLPLKTSLLLRYSLNSGSAFSGSYLSRFQAALHYQDSGNSARLTFYSFDREVISLVDSTYIASSGQNFRLLLFARYYFRPHFFQELDCSYRLEDKADYTQNTYRVSLALGYDRKKLHFKAGFLSWQSPRSFLAEDEFSPDYYSVCTSDDSVLFASAQHQFKRWQISAYVRKSLLHKEDYQFNLSLGLSLI